MSSKVEICNVALTLLRAGRINELDEGTQPAQDLNAIYDIVSESVQAIGPWPSTIRRASLARLEEVPEFQYSYYYQLPVNPRCLRVLEVDEVNAGDIKYQVEAGKIATDEETFKVRYIAYITDSELYDSYLKQSIIEHLMAYISYSQTGDRNVFLKAMDTARMNALHLISYASAQGGSKDINSGGLVEARF